MTDKNSEKKDRPLVTFALFAYNQEKYIREAIEGAFSQTYEPLEIILSDDCSTDRTFEIMQEMAEAYEGPHSVRARQNGTNLGVFMHVLSVAHMSCGKLIVLAAGDDISKKSRTREIANCWMETRAWGFHSYHDIIDDQGKILQRSVTSEFLRQKDYRLRTYFYIDEGPVEIVHGCTSAYDRRAFDFPIANSYQPILSEDGMMSLWLNLIKQKVVFIDKSLMKYRRHRGALTNAGKTFRALGYTEYIELDKRSELYARSSFNRAKYFLDLVALSNINKRRVNQQEVDKDIYRFDILSTWGERSIWNRISALLDPRMKSSRKWMCLRLFGYTPLSILKFMLQNRRSGISITDEKNNA